MDHIIKTQEVLNTVSTSLTAENLESIKQTIRFLSSLSYTPQNFQVVTVTLQILELLSNLTPQNVANIGALLGQIDSQLKAAAGQAEVSKAIERVKKSARSKKDKIEQKENNNGQEEAKH